LGFKKLKGNKKKGMGVEINHIARIQMINGNKYI
jgi:hypothetical protein